MTTFEKLAEKIKTDLGYNVENIKRTYAGINMKSSGAFTWCGNEVGSFREIGGCCPAKETLERYKLESIHHRGGRTEII